MTTLKVKEICFGCKKELYSHERMCLNEQVFHQGCAKCSVCSKKLTLQDFAVGGDVWYCKHHYKEAFARSGGKYPGQGTIKKKPTWKETLEKMAEEAEKTAAKIPATATQASKPVAAASKPTPTLVIKPGEASIAKPPAQIPFESKPKAQVSTGPTQSQNAASPSFTESIHSTVQDAITSLKMYVEELVDSLKARLDQFQSESMQKIKQQLTDIASMLQSVQSLDVYLSLKAQLEAIATKVSEQKDLLLNGSKAKVSSSRSTHTDAKAIAVQRTMTTGQPQKQIVKTFSVVSQPSRSGQQTFSNTSSGSSMVKARSIQRSIPSANGRSIPPSWAYVASSSC